MRPSQSTGCSRSQEVGNATTASAIETFSGRHLSGFVCYRRMQPYSSPPDRLKNTSPHVGPTTSLRTVMLRGDRGLAHTVAMIEVTCDVSFGLIASLRLCDVHFRFAPSCEITVTELRITVTVHLTQFAVWLWRQLNALSPLSLIHIS